MAKYETSKVIIKYAGMPLRKLATNDELLQATFEERESDLITEWRIIELTRIAKVLCMTWDMTNDKLYINDCKSFEYQIVKRNGRYDV